jgi:hypothetical protein
MKLNPLEWNQVDETTFQAQGLLLLRSSQPFAFTVETFGMEVAVGPASYHEIPLPDAAKVTLLGGKAKIYRKTPPPRLVVSNEETFTNIDRLPHESGTMMEVTKALRLMRIEERATIRRIREQRDLDNDVIEFRRLREKAEPPQGETAPEPGPTE